MSNDNHDGHVQLEPIRGRAGNYDPFDDRVSFPINHKTVRDLLGRVLTQLDAMGLPDRAHAAAKSLLTREVWRWWADACDNAATSYKGCIAPVVTIRTSWPIGEDPDVKEVSNRWGWPSEGAWRDSLKEPPLRTISVSPDSVKLIVAEGN